MGGDEKMDENLINQTLEEYDVAADDEIHEIDVDVEDVEPEVVVEEEIHDVTIEQEDETVIDISESMGWVSGDNRYHDSLLGVDSPNQHPITAISNLKEELDEIKRLKTVYSDKFNVANYYKWHDASYDEYGYFVSLVPNTDMIKICEGLDVFGVSVNTAGFVGGKYEDVPTGSYGLIVTSGLVDVRCETDVEVGDYVISNTRGYARKSDSDYGYKVFAKENKNGVEYAVILLGVQADLTNTLGIDLAQIKDRVDVNEKNIVSAINVANQAYNKSSEATSASEEALKKALEAVLNSETAVDTTTEMNKVLESTNSVATQAKAIAESAVTTSATLKDEAITRANDAWSKADAVATEAYSLCAKIDQYSVGEYSQAYNLTLEQAHGILEVGMIYVPTKHMDTESHKEEYVYVKDDKSQVYEREFIPGYLYRWDYISNVDIRIGWLTIGESPSVYFSAVEPVLNDRLEYWYTDGDVIADIKGNTNTYESYTLYKWETDHWLAVATLKGNSSSRAISDIYQSTNEISSQVSNTIGAVAGISQRLDDTESKVKSYAYWPKDPDSGWFNLATIDQSADKDGSNLTLAAVDLNGETIINGAKIVLSQSGGNSFIQLSANQLDFGSEETERIKIDANNINFEADDYIINASHINLTGAVTISSFDNDVASKLNNSIRSTEITYALSDSSDVAPTSGWSTTAPEWQANKYMWQKTVITYTDTTKTPTVTTTCIQGAKGEDGQDGRGVAIKGTAYAETVDLTIDDTFIGESLDLYSDPDRIESIVGAQPGDAYLVEGYLFIYSEDGAFVCTGKIQGPQGVRGPKGENGDTSYFHIKYSDVENPTDEQITEIPSTYIGTYVDYTKEDSTSASSYKWSRFQGLQGKTGEQGIPGEDGANGQTSYLHIKYSNDGGQTFTANNGEDPGDYIGQYVDFEKNDSVDVTKYTWVKTKGEKGQDGSDGVSITSVVPQYCLSSNGSIAPTTGWTADLNSITWTPSNYIWCREEIVYSNNTTSHTTPKVDESLSLVGQWCSTADKTFIDGSKIYTGSITANQLATDAITSLNYVVNTSGSKLSLADGSFDSKNFKISSDGAMTATAGYIGGDNGWVITTDYIYSASSSLYLFGSEDGTARNGSSPIATNYGANITNLVIRAGKSSTAKFGVGSDGKVYASDAYISGKINASQGYVGNWQIVDGLLRFEHEDNADFVAEIAPGGINLNAHGGWFSVYTPQDDAYSNEFSILMRAGNVGLTLNSTTNKGELTGNWYHHNQLMGGYYVQNSGDVLAFAKNLKAGVYTVQNLYSTIPSRFAYSMMLIGTNGSDRCNIYAYASDGLWMNCYQDSMWLGWKKCSATSATP